MTRCPPAILRVRARPSTSEKGDSSKSISTSKKQRIVAAAAAAAAAAATVVPRTSTDRPYNIDVTPDLLEDAALLKAHFDSEERMG